MRTPLLVILGPTASGKSALAVKLATRHGGEVVSADSRQVYRRLNALTGKISPSETRGVPHHMLDVIDPGEPYSAHSFVLGAVPIISAIYSRGSFPVVAGGSGFYIDALLFEGALSEAPADPAYRKQLERLDLRQLQERLQRKDPRAYDSIDTRNSRRLIRALEIVRSLGVFPLRKRVKRYDYHMIGIKRTRPHLLNRIQKRLDARFDSMVSEMRALLDDNVDPAWLDGLGLECRHIQRMFTRGISREKTRTDLSRAIFAYAKRQNTWFRRYPEAYWYSEHESKKMHRSLDILYGNRTASSRRS